MAIDKTILSEAVQLLNEIEVALSRRSVSVRRQGSTRVLSARVRKLRDLLENEQKRPTPAGHTSQYSKGSGEAGIGA
jgi:hypothetical protein